MTPKKLVKREAEKFTALDALAKSEGGGILSRGLARDITASLQELTRVYRTGTHAELIALAARITERLALYQVLARAPKNRKWAEDDLVAILAEGDEDE